MPTALVRESSHLPHWRKRCAGSFRSPIAPTTGCPARRPHVRRSAAPARSPRMPHPSSTCAGTAAARRWSSHPGRCRAAGRPRGRKAESEQNWDRPLPHFAVRRGIARCDGRVALMPTALITGASGGLGSAIATALAPTHTLLLGGRPSRRLDELATQLGATTVPLELTDTAGLEAGVEVITELDVLVHNAGAADFGNIADSSIDDWR